ncbi:RNA 3'-terminal phosphate cyclase, partial [Candidatus Omnitrophota bacterium]
PKPGLKAQHLHIIKTLTKLFKADTHGADLDSQEITFAPNKDSIESAHYAVDMQTAGSIGLFLQTLLPLGVFKSGGLTLSIVGGTAGLGQVPVEHYPRCLLPVLFRFGVKAEVKIIRYGYYPVGAGEVSVSISPGKNLKAISLTRQGTLQRISGISVASQDLIIRDVCQRQAKAAEDVLKQQYNCPITIQAQYVDTRSPGTEINLYAHTRARCILSADSRGEKSRPAEEVGAAAAKILQTQLNSQAGCDAHCADNIIPWLVLLGGEITASEITTHTKTNMWVAEQFFGKIFTIEDNRIKCEKITV